MNLLFREQLAVTGNAVLYKNLPQTGRPPIQVLFNDVKMHLCRKLQILVRLIKADLDECLNVLYKVLFAKKVIKEGRLERAIRKAL